MKNSIKAILLLLMFVLISFPTFSQFKIGVKAGLNIANVRQDMEDSEDEWETLPRLLYHVGPTFDIGFGKFLSLQPSLLLSTKGFGIDVDKMSDGEASGYARYTLTYLEVPINVAFKFKGFQVYAGPYFAFGLAGVYKWDVEAGEFSEDGSEKLKMVGSSWNSEESDDYEAVRRLDYGLGFGAGYKLGPVLFSAGLSLGLANLTPDDTAYDNYDPKDYKASTLTGVISVSYYFGKWK